MKRVVLIINIVLSIANIKCQETDQPAPTGSKKNVETYITAQPTCRIPPYPERGSYVVVNEPGARPGDSFQNLTLIQYSTDERHHLVEVNAFVCSLGEWYLKALQYEVEDAFDVGSCPLFCAKSSDVKSSAQRKKPSKYRQNEVKPQKFCKLPGYPEKGWYYVTTKAQTRPGQTLSATYLLYYCSSGYKILGNQTVLCFNGIWYSSEPKCVKESPSLATDTDTVESSADNTTECKLPEYPTNGQYSAQNLPQAKPGEIYDTLKLEYFCKDDSKIVGDRKVYCINGIWSSKLPKCVRCGFITNTGAVNVSTSPLPWHVGVYDKSSTHSHICGGSIVATNLVVSAASCFWTKPEGILPASRFAVAAGKLYRAWDDSRDAFAQNSDVNKIVVPSRFRGELTNFQNDIAMLFLTTPLTYSDYVAPVCIDFDIAFEESQLKPQNVGKIGIWGSTNENAEESTVLQIKNVTYVDINECITNASPELRVHITSDKICAAACNGTELEETCRGDGLVFPAMDKEGGLVNYYLRGVVPASSKDGENSFKPSVAIFTQFTVHEFFYKTYFESAIW